MTQTNAEKQRRYRERKRAQADPVRSFLRAVTEQADEERMAGTATATTFRLAAIAATTLDKADAIPETQNFWASFARQHHIPGAIGRGKNSARRQRAAATLTWVNQERVAGRAKPVVIREGLRAATVLVQEPIVLNHDAIERWFAELLSGVRINGGTAPTSSNSCDCSELAKPHSFGQHANWEEIVDDDISDMDPEDESG